MKAEPKEIFQPQYFEFSGSRNFSIHKSTNMCQNLWSVQSPGQLLSCTHECHTVQSALSVVCVIEKGTFKSFCVLQKSGVCVKEHACM